MRVEEEQVHAIEFNSIDLGASGQVEHGIEVNAGFGAGAAFADEARPHCIVEFGIIAVAVLRAHKMLFGKLRQRCKSFEGRQCENRIG